MKKVRSVAIVSCLVFLLSLAIVSCAKHSSETMNKGSMGTTIDSMNQEKRGSDMEKPMDSMNGVEKDENIKKDMQNNMK
jgi:hypothetical protein